MLIGSPRPHLMNNADCPSNRRNRHGRRIIHFLHRHCDELTASRKARAAAGALAVECPSWRETRVACRTQVEARPAASLGEHEALATSGRRRDR